MAGIRSHAGGAGELRKFPDAPRAIRGLAADHVERMGDRVRFCPPAGPGPESSAHFKKLERNSARLVPEETTSQQKVDEVLAISAWCHGFPAAGFSRGASCCAAIQPDLGIDSPGPFVPAVAGREIGAKQSAACFATL